MSTFIGMNLKPKQTAKNDKNTKQTAKNDKEKSE